MASFQAKTGWKRLKKKENKNYRFVPTRRIRDNSKKNRKKNSKNLKTLLWLHFKPK